MNHNLRAPQSPPQTNWYVITGAPCSGKTTVIQGLARRRLEVVPEAARAHIDHQLNLGRKLSDIKADILSFERQILQKKIQIENKLPKTRTIIMDRAIPDSVAYYQIEGLDWREPLGYCQFVRYKKIFLFDLLSFEKDAVRSEDQALASHIETLLKKCYHELGYSIIRIPVMPVNQRIELVLKHICPHIDLNARKET